MAWTKSLGRCRFALNRETGRPSAAACLSLSCLHCVLASCRRLAANHIIIIFVITRSCSSLKVFGVTWVKQQHYQRPRKFLLRSQSRKVLLTLLTQFRTLGICVHLFVKKWQKWMQNDKQKDRQTIQITTNINTMTIITNILHSTAVA